MNKLFVVFATLFTIFVVSINSAIVYAAPPTPPGGTIISGSIVKVKGDRGFKLSPYTVATLPTLANTTNDIGALYLVTDGADGADCVTGSGSTEVICRWTGTAFEAAAGSVTEIEAGAFDFTTWNANTNGGTKDAIRDQLFVYDTDGDGDIDSIDGAVGGGDITGVGPAGTAAGDALTDGYQTSGATLFIFEGTTVDTNEYIINVPAADPAGDLTWTFPSVTGTLLTADGIGTALTALDGENIQDDTIDDDSLDFSDITLDDFVSAEGDYLSVAADDTFDFTRNDAGTVTITASDDDATAALTILPGGAAVLTLGGASSTTITATTDGGSVTLDGLVAIGTDPADQGVIRLENATIIAWEDATETTITHVDDTGLAINTGLTVGGTFGATGVVALGDGGDNFSVSSDGIDIDTSGNITNAGTISAGKITSSAAFESATGTFDVTGAAAITIGSADVTAVTITTDDTGDGSDLVLPAQSVNGSEMLNNTVTATQLAAALTMADGDIIDLGGVTHSAAADEGLVLPTWANVAPTSDKKFLAADGSNLKLYNGGWVTIGASAAPTDAQYLTLAVDATLSAERVLTAGYALDFTDAGANGTLTVALDTTEISADGTDTFSDNSQASVAWTINTSGVADNVITFTDGLTTFNDALTVTDTLTATNGIALGTSKSITGTTGLTIGAGTETVAINSSDWDIDATGVMTGIGNVTSNGVITSTGFTIGAAAITEAELEILDGATTTTTQLNYLNAATGTTGTASTNLVFSAAPTFTGTMIAADIDGSGTFSANLFTPDAADGADIGSATLEFSDIYVADGSVIYGGNDQDSTITHVADTGWQFNNAISIADDKALTLGGNLAGYDWTIIYDELTSDALEFTHTAGAGADVTFDLNDNVADSTFTITNSDATYEANVSVEGDITIGGTLTVSSSGASYITLNNNAAGRTPGAGEYGIYFETDTTDQLKYSINGGEKAVMNLGDAQTATAVKTFEAGAYIGDADTAGVFRIYDGTGEYYAIATGNQTASFTLTVPNGGSINKYLYDTDGAGTLGWGTPSAAASTDGGEGGVQYNTGGALDADASFNFAEATYTLLIGESNLSSLDGKITLFNEGGTDYTVTIQPGTQSGNATITLPGATGTLATLGNNETISGAKGFSSAPFSSVANTTALGTAAGEWADLYLGDGAIIYAQNDQSNTLTSAAGGWTTNLPFTVTGVINTSVGLDAVGAVDMDYGSGDVTDHTFTTDGGTVILDGSVTASAGVDLGTSQALVGTTAMTIGNNGQTVAINSSDWDIDATGAMTGIGAITSDGAVTATSFIAPIYDVTGAAGITIGSADVTTVTLSGQAEDLVFTPSADLWTLSSSTGATLAITPAIALNGGTTLAANDILSSEIATIVDSAYWDAGGMTPDGTQCADAARVTINSGPVQYTVICADNDASSLYGHIVMPDSWDGGTVTFELEYLQTAVDTAVLNGDIAAQCRGATEVPSSTWGDEIAIDNGALTGSNAVDHTTSAAVTPAGTCAGGDSLWWRWQMDATGTTTAVATLHFLGMKMEYTSNVGD